ncbi:protein SCAR3-like [Iris pallida]|uniref:Protein SCAR n=1 Tax=Iris pallida TaxID=29817 RepID=A0AAX6F2T8_IRIPA|nr:protein SCAR3-like [Iris pallida]
MQEVFIPQESSSTQFASPGTDHLSFSDENISMTDTKSKSELERESTFFDSETRVNFQVTDMHPMVYNDLECNGSSASTSNINHSDAPVNVLHNEPVENTADDDSLQELSAPSSSSVTWDEKTEIVKPASPELCDVALLYRDQDAVPLPLDSESSNLDCENAKLGKSNQGYIEFDVGEIPVSLSYGNHFDNVTSETENYLDANNTLESEIETDGEFLSKREVKTIPNCSYPDRKSELSELKETDSSLDCNDAQASVASCSSTDDYIPPRLSNLVPSDGFGHDQSMCVTDFVPKHDSSVKIDYNGSHISYVSGVSGYGDLNADVSPELSTVSEQVEQAENTEAKIFKPQDPPAASLQVPSFRCWTNGGILGLEPSKPPDFSMLNGRSIENSETLVCGEGMTRNMFFVDESVTSHDISVKTSQESFQVLSLGELDKNREIYNERTYANDHGLVLKETNATHPVSNLVGYASIESQFNGFEHSISASVPELAHRLLANSLQTRISVNNVDVPTPSELVNDDCRKSERISLQNVHPVVPNGVLSHTSHGLDNEKMEVESSVKLASNSSLNPGSSSSAGTHENLISTSEWFSDLQTEIGVFRWKSS